MNLIDLKKWLIEKGYNPGLIHSVEVGILRSHTVVWEYYSRSRGGGAASVGHHPELDVYGLILEIDESLVPAFDKKEGVNINCYKPVEKTVHTLNGKPLNVRTYVAVPNRNGLKDIWPTRGYLNLIIQAATEHRFPEDYLMKLSRIPTVN